MKILFVTDDYVIDPLGIAYLSSYLKKDKHSVDIVKAKKENIFEKIKEYKPDLLAYSITTGKHVYYKELNMQIKKVFPNLISVVGGSHITFFPEFVNEEGIDYGIAGEGFEAFPELIQGIESNLNINGIQNVVLKNYKSKIRPLYNKNNLLLPDRDLIYKYSENRNNRIKNIMCSFGCPFSCPYCYNNKYKEIYNLKMPELRSVENVIDEVEDLMRFPLELIFFQDDLFPIYDKKWIDSFCENYKCGIPFHIQIRLEMVTDDVLNKLKNVGLHSVTFAIETGNELLRKTILKRNMSNALIRDKVALIKKYNLKYRAENMIGIPEETLASALETLDLNIKIAPTIAWASVFQPYPGTELGDMCVKKNIYDSDINSISSSFFDNYILDIPNKNKYSRLQKLFPLIVDHKWLRPLVKLLINLPLDEQYSKIFLWYKKYLYDRKLYVV